MLNKKEITTIIVLSIVLAFSFSLLKSLSLFFYLLLSVFLIIIINLVAKKIAAFYLDSEIEIKSWDIKQIGFKKTDRLKKPFPAGIFLPIIFSLITQGFFVWMANLVFEVKPKIYRAAKRHGLYSFSEMTESHIGLIATAGIFANLLFAAIGYLIGFPEQMNFVKLNIFYAFFNIIPFSSLDGNKIFFGNKVLWSFLAALVIIGMAYAFLVI